MRQSNLKGPASFSHHNSAYLSLGPSFAALAPGIQWQYAACQGSLFSLSRPHNSLGHQFSALFSSASEKTQHSDNHHPFSTACNYALVFFIWEWMGSQKFTREMPSIRSLQGYSATVHLNTHLFIFSVENQRTEYVTSHQLQTRGSSPLPKLLRSAIIPPESTRSHHVNFTVNSESNPTLATWVTLLPHPTVDSPRWAQPDESHSPCACSFFWREACAHQMPRTRKKKRERDFKSNQPSTL